MRQNFMSCKYIIDAYAWVEYFRASELGAIAREYIESENSATPTIVISEISRKLQKEITLGNETREGRLKRLEFIRATRRIIDLDFETAAEACKINETLKGKARGWGLADSIILSTAMSLKGKVVTGDEHFRELEEVFFLKK
jgi:predicted nucleic acid-binding protein